MPLSKQEKTKLAAVCWETAQELWKMGLGFALYAQALEEDARHLSSEAKTAPG